MQEENILFFATSNNGFVFLRSDALNNGTFNTYVALGATAVVLQTHLLPTGALNSTQFIAGGTNALYYTSNNSTGTVSKVRVNLYTGGSWTVNGAFVSTADVQLTNGVLHIVDYVVLPAADISNPAVGSLFPSLTTLLSLVNSAGLSGAIGALNNLTVFAPTNAAFTTYNNTVGIPTGQALLPFLQYHVSTSPQTFFRDGFTAGPLPTLTIPTQFIAVTVGGSGSRQTVSLNGNAIGFYDITLTNGVVHVVNTVLTPPVVTTVAAAQVTTVAQQTTAVAQQTTASSPSNSSAGFIVCNLFLTLVALFFIKFM